MTINARSISLRFVWVVLLLNLVCSWLYRMQAQAPAPAAAAPQAKAVPAEAPNFVGKTAVLDASNISSGRRYFEAGARSNWHAHPNGQLILNESGEGMHQVRGGPIERLKPGQAVYVGPGVEHWHGAAPVAALTQVNIGFGGSTKWGAPVTDAEYSGGARKEEGRGKKAE